MMKAFGILAVAAWLAASGPVLAENLTVSPAGTGGGSGSGTVEQVCTAGGATGGCITTTGTISTTFPNSANTPSGASYTMQATDAWSDLVLPSGFTGSLVIPQATTIGFGTGVSFTITNETGSARAWSVTTSTLGGLASGSLPSGGQMAFQSDGTNYHFTSSTGTSTPPGGSSGQLQTNNGSGGFGAVAAPAGTVVGTSDAQAITNKTQPCFTNSLTDVLCGAPLASNSGSQVYLYNPSTPNTSGVIFAAITDFYCTIGYSREPHHITLLESWVAVVGTTTASLGLYDDAIDSSGSHHPNNKLANTVATANTSLGLFQPAAFTSAAVPQGIVWTCASQADTTGHLLQYVGSAASGGSFYTQMVGASSLANLVDLGGTLGVVPQGIFITGQTANTWPPSLNGAGQTLTNSTPVIAASGLSIP